MTDEDPFEPFRNLRDKLIETTEPLGLKVVGFSIMPGEDKLSPNGAHVLFEIDPDVLRTEEDRATKDSFDQMMTMEKEHDHRQRAEEARARMQEQLAAGGGFLDDEDEEPLGKLAAAIQGQSKLDACVAAGTHLQSCDDDGYCNVCGHQESDDDEEEFDPAEGCPKCGRVLGTSDQYAHVCDNCGWYHGIKVQSIRADDFLKGFE